jgi:hypothetical protein
VSEHRWNEIVARLNNPKSILYADAIAVLLLRTRYDKGPDGKALVDIVSVRKILDYWRTNREAKEEMRIPVGDAYRFLHNTAASRMKPGNPQ